MVELLSPGLLLLLVSRAASGRHVNVYGGPGSGKTRLLQAVERELVGQLGMLSATVHLDVLLQDPTPQTFWRVIAAALPGDAPAIADPERLPAQILKRLGDRKLLLAIDGLDQILDLEDLRNLKFLGALRGFATNPAVSTFTTSVWTLTEVHRSLERTLGRMPTSPLNFMSEQRIEMPELDIVAAYVAHVAPHLGPADIRLIYSTALGHPRLTAALTDALRAEPALDVSRRIKAASRVLEAEDLLLGQIFRAWPPSHAFSLVCEVLSSLADGEGGSNWDEPIPMPMPNEFLATCHRAIVACHDTATAISAGLNEFDATLGVHLPDAAHLSIEEFSWRVVKLLSRCDQLEPYLRMLDRTSRRRRHLVEALALRPSLQALPPVPTIRHRYEHYVFGDCATFFVGQSVVVAGDVHVEAVAHIWRWWVIRQLGTRLAAEPSEWLTDHGIERCITSKNLELLARLMRGAHDALMAGSRQAIRAVALAAEQETR